MHSTLISARRAKENSMPNRPHLFHLLFLSFATTLLYTWWLMKIHWAIESDRHIHHELERERARDRQKKRNRKIIIASVGHITSHHRVSTDSPIYFIFKCKLHNHNFIYPFVLCWNTDAHAVSPESSAIYTVNIEETRRYGLRAACVVFLFSHPIIYTQNSIYLFLLFFLSVPCSVCVCVSFYLFCSFFRLLIVTI